MRRAEHSRIDHEVVRRGMVLCESNAAAPVTMAEAELRILDSVKGKVKDYLEAQLHVGRRGVSPFGDARKHRDDRWTKSR